MSRVTEKLMSLGSFEVTFDGDPPKSLLDRLALFDHIIITRTRVDLSLLGDTDALAFERAIASDVLYPSTSLYPSSDLFSARSRIYDMAVYTGVVRRMPTGDEPTVVGVGMAFWLGDHEDKGDIFETAIEFTGETFEGAVVRLLPEAVAAGDIEPLGGSYTDSVHLVTPRKALHYVCDLFDAEWRANPDGTLDAGTTEHLYGDEPTAVAVRKGIGFDIDYESLRIASLNLETDGEDITTRTLLIGQGSGDQTVIATADGPKTAYRDLHGNPVVLKRMVFESETSHGNADARAQLHQNRFANPKNRLELSLSDYDVKGNAALGRNLWVFDPDVGAYDLANQVTFRGETIYPIRLRVVGTTWPVIDEMGVYHRDRYGRLTDITEYVSTGVQDTVLQVGVTRRTLLRLDQQREALLQRLNS